MVAVLSLLILCAVIDIVSPAKIIGIFPYPGFSHQKVFDPLLKALADRGHDVTIATFFPNRYHKQNSSEIDLRSLSNIKVNDIDMKHLENPSWLLQLPVIGNVIRQYKNLVDNLSVSSVSICEKLVLFTPLMEALNKTYDLVIVEQFTSDCVLGLLEVYGNTAPIIGMSSCSPMPWTRQRLGVEHNPSFVPIITSSLSSQMSFFERLENTLHNIMMREVYYYKIQLKEQAIIEKQFGRKISDLHDAANNITLLFVNSHYTLNGVRPLVPGLVEVGGIHMNVSEKKTIPEYIQKFTNNSHNGVILLSFGSRLKLDTLSKTKQDTLIRVFSRLKQRVIWKYEDHTNVLTIICHGGYLGMTEAISAGKPMVIIPMYGDQGSNAASAKEVGVAEVLSLQDLNENNLMKALETVLGPEKQEQARLISQIWRDRANTPLDTAVYWTERVIRWGHRSPLHSTARNLSLYQYALLDIALFVIGLVTSIIVVILSLCRLQRVINNRKIIKLE
ncbi:unnamed protein product [Leptidea sinapis]|uniref:UDP-glucuronosyltransferase n=1 Tax=Leptidea sinapis TaxID=189913 RepID=A0A5E4QJP2_9NEOP|nr:unnamed protein product [Leptidea sinapis]